MRRVNMRKSIAGLLIVSAMLCLGACGQNAAQTSDDDGSKHSATGNISQQESDTSEENTASPAEDDNLTAGAETDGAAGSPDSSVTVVMMSEDNAELATDDGTVYYTITCSYPVVSIAGNETAAEKINADIRSRVDAYNTSVNMQAETAKQDFEYLLSDEDIDYMPFPYSSDLSFTVTRADDNVIAFTENNYEYMGGAHGMPSTIGINYDAKTGELITFGDLSDDPDAFRADTLVYNQELAGTEYYSMQMFNTDDITNGTLEDVLYTDGAWYLSTSGLIFMSPPYALAPYAAGTLEFTIPYSELENMGLKEQYTYTGRQIVKMIENESYIIDLNGNGTDDSVSYYDAWIDDETDSYEFQTHLIINGTDYSQDGSDDVREQLLLPGGIVGVVGVCLYDLDVNDNYVEIAVLSVNWIQNEDDNNPVANYYSQFFRYTEDGSLIYLGQADGDVTDPTVSVTVSDLQ